MLCEGVVMMQCCMWDVRMSDIARRYCWVWHDCNVVQKCIRNFVDVLV